MLSNRINYTADIGYIINSFIYEYDIEKANITILYLSGILDKETYNRLYNLERMVRQRYIGMMEKNDPNIVKVLQQGIIEAKNQLFAANQIQDYEILSIKNDAVFTINKPLQNTRFGLINFVQKNQYTAFYRIQNLELYYYYNSFNQEEYLHVKGINDIELIKHNEYILQLLKDIFYSIQVSGIEIAIRMLKDFYMEYIKFNVPVGYYRQFNCDSIYKYHVHTNIGTGFGADNVPENLKYMLDISYNACFLSELQKILISIYTTKFK